MGRNDERDTPLDPPHSIFMMMPEEQKLTIIF
jgi:hypothetical protein